MNTRSFVAALVASLAWPLTVLVSLLLVRKILVSMVPLIRTLKYSELEISFGREVADIRLAGDAAAITGKAAAAKSEAWEELTRLASVRPRSAIRGAWQQIEGALRGAATKHHLKVAEAPWPMPMVLGSLLFNAGAISDSQYSLLSRLRRLVPQAERAPVDSVSSEDASEFVALAHRLTASIA